MRNFLLALALVAPLSAQAAPHLALKTAPGEPAAKAALADDEAMSGPFPMALSTTRPTGGTPGALSEVFGGDISTELLAVFLDETLEIAMADAMMPFNPIKLPPIAGSWLLGMSRPPVLLPEPFSYTILSIGLLGFIVSRFRRTP